MWDDALRYGKKRLFDRLVNVDPESARDIHPHDTKRIIRSLEVYRITGSKMSDLKKKTTGIKDTFDIRLFGVTKPREAIYRSTDDRVEEMFRRGLVREVASLLRKRLSVTARAALGLKEVAGYLQGKYPLDEAKRLLKRNTRHFVKKQLTWFRPDRSITWFNASTTTGEKIIKKIIDSTKQ